MSRYICNDLNYNLNSNFSVQNVWNTSTCDLYTESPNKNNCSDISSVLAILILIGGIMIAVGPITQIIQMIRTKQTRDVNMTWTVIYIIGLSISIPFNFKNRIWVILIGTSIEICNLTTIFILKNMYERRILWWRFGKPTSHQLPTKKFNRIVSNKGITFELSMKELFEFTNSHPEDSDIATISFSKNELEHWLHECQKIKSGRKNSINVNMNNGKINETIVDISINKNSTDNI